MGGTRALCRSRISRGELPAGRNIVCTSQGAGERDPELEQQFGLPQKPCLGMGMLGSDRGDSSTLTSWGRWSQALCYLGCALQQCQPACLDSTSACAKSVTGPFFHCPSVPYQSPPLLRTCQCCWETRLCLHHRPLLSPGQDLASLVTQWGEAELNRTKINPNNKVTDCPGEGEYLQLLFIRKSARDKVSAQMPIC